MMDKMNLRPLLAKRASLSNKEATAMLAEGRVEVNGRVVKGNPEISAADEVKLDGRSIKTGKKNLYMALHKPRGVETTLNPAIPDNLLPLLPPGEKLFPVGRLDKDSEGLLLLTNDGAFFEQTIHPQSVVEKEYIVEVTPEITPEFLVGMSIGVVIMGKTTLPCKVIMLSNYTFSIILTEGRNRQIRRMCHQFGYEVTMLKRIRIGSVEMGDLAVGARRWVNMM